MKKFAIAATFAALFVGISFIHGCANTANQSDQIAVALTNVCQAATTSLRIATALNKAGKLNQDDRTRITLAANGIDPLCNAAKPPTDVTSALSTVSAASVQIAAVLAQYGVK